MILLNMKVKPVPASLTLNGAGLGEFLISCTLRETGKDKVFFSLYRSVTCVNAPSVKLVVNPVPKHLQIIRSIDSKFMQLKE